jgi:hypothetical protein
VYIEYLDCFLIPKPYIYSTESGGGQILRLVGACEDRTERERGHDMIHPANYNTDPLFSDGLSQELSVD